MKSKRVLAAVLAAVLMLPVTGLPAAAAFPDVTGNWSWASAYIEDMTAKGIFNGYEDGTFRPARELSTGEALALCARIIGLPAAVTSAIAADRASEITAIMGTAQSWFHADYAVCLELGVVTSAELKSMWRSGALAASVNKETFAVYLVRAMGLDRLADTLPSYSMSFADVSSITEAFRPCVYLLNAYGIVEGTTDNRFEPKASLNRAISATMLSRVADFIKNKGLSVELANYTTYDWTAGIIAAAEAGDAGAVLLTLTEGTATRVVTIPANVPIYLNNMPVGATSLKTGMYARVCLNGSTPVSVRLVPADRLKTVTAAISELTGSSITLAVDGVAQTYPLDRFTQVTAGGRTGGRDLIDTAGGYTEAVCTMDGIRILTLKLSGGTSPYTGLVSAVSATDSGTALQVTSFSGVTRTFTVPPGAAVTVNGLTGTLKTSHIGRYVSLRVSNDEAGRVIAAAVDTETKYIQATVLGVTYTSVPNTIYAKNVSTGESVVYTMADNPVITYEGAAVSFRNVAKDWYFTAKLDASGRIAALEAYPGSVTVEGTLKSIAYGATTVLTVTGENEQAYVFSLDMAALPVIRRSGLVSSIDKLRAGDTVSVTSQYNKVSLIESTPQQANVTGTVVRVIREVTGSTLELKLDDGSTASYAVTTATSITKAGVAMSLSSVEPGFTVALLVSGGQVISVEVKSTASSASSTELTGTVLYVNTADKTLLLRLTDLSGTDYVITVNAPYGTAVLGTDGGSLSLYTLAIGDTVTVYGAYRNAEFDARVIIRK